MGENYDIYEVIAILVNCMYVLCYCRRKIKKSVPEGHFLLLGKLNKFKTHIWRKFIWKWKR